MEQKMREATAKFDGDLAGSYKSLIEMTNSEKNTLIEEHILFNDGDNKYLRSAGGYKDWPVTKFIFV
jgi:hypothetical protein